jgi:hypothetical protein
LEDLYRKVLIARGQRDEAVKHAWSCFEETPSDYTLKTVLEIALAKEHPTLKQKAIEIFEESSINRALEGLYYLGEVERLVCYLQKVKNLLERCGEEDEWNRLANELSQDHRIKSAFRPGLKNIIAGESLPREPSFMEKIASKLNREE